MAPHNGIDAIFIGSQLITALYSITSKDINPMNA